MRKTTEILFNDVPFPASEKGPLNSSSILVLTEADVSQSEPWVNLPEHGRCVFFVRSFQEAFVVLSKEMISVLFIDNRLFSALTVDSLSLLEEASFSGHLTFMVLVSGGAADFSLDEKFDRFNIDFLDARISASFVERKIAYVNRHNSIVSLLSDTQRRLDKVVLQFEEYAYIVSHDLKAPLRGLSTLSQFIEEEIGETASSAAKEMLTMMMGRTDRMQAMMDGLLHYSRITSGHFRRQKIDVKELVNSVLDDVSPSQKVKLDFSEIPECFETDPMKFQEVVRNIIDNALHFNESDEKALSIGVRDLGNHLEFSITDNGIGINADQHERVFGLFQTLHNKERTNRLGIGLSIVKRLVEQQNGRVWIASQPGKGCTVGFTWSKA